MSALADALLIKYADVIRTPGPQCGVAKSGRAALVDALAGRAPMSAIARVLQREGIALTPSTVRHHITGGCRCSR